MNRIINTDSTFTLDESIKESERCLACRLPACVKACPLNVNAPKILALMRQGDTRGAYKELMSRNVLAEYSCYFCMARKFCVGACNARKKKESFLINIPQKGINLPYLELFLTKRMRDIGENFDLNNETNKRSVTILGSTACGISAALILANSGFNVSIYEQEKEFGPNLRSGLTDKKKANELVDQYEHDLLAMGTVIYKGINVLNDIDVSTLKKDSDYFIIATNFENRVRFNFTGEAKLYSSPLNQKLKFLCYVAEFYALENRETYFNKDEKVLVLGSTSEVLDCARIVNKFSNDVTVVFDGAKGSIGVRDEDIEKGISKDIKVEYLSVPVAVVQKNRKVLITFMKIKQEIDEEDGTLINVPIIGSEYTVECDHVIVGPSSKGIISKVCSKLPGIMLDKDFHIIVDQKYQASSETTTYAGGSAINNNTSLYDEIYTATKIANAIIDDSGANDEDFKSIYEKLSYEQTQAELQKNLAPEEKFNIQGY
ncbi:MAG: FAD-dependent oxidoreductase [Clostridia bacterium]|nr:FAD-dependent oxidoreductase [Clostridia bacterium]